MTVTEKVAYIKGLAEGLDLDKTTKEGKLFSAIIDVLDDIALTVADTCDQVDAIDEDLADLEEFIYEDDEDDENIDWDDELCPGDCDGCNGCDDLDDEDGLYEFECPNCHETVFFDESLMDDEDDYDLECPACGAKLDMASIFEEDNED